MFESYLKPPISFPSVSGSVCTFNSQYAGLPLKSHTVAVTATQSGTGTPSPSNPRSINGHSIINISQSGADTSNPTVYTITIGSTVYGGEYDGRSGVFKVTHEGVVFDGSTDELWQTATVSGVTYYYLENTLNVDNSFRTSLTNPLCKCNLYKEDNSILNSSYLANCADFSFCNQSTFPKRLWVINRSITSLADFKTALSNQNLVIVYPLATPMTIQLPPCPIDTLLGVNNIWADTGDTTLQYPKFG